MISFFFLFSFLVHAQSSNSLHLSSPFVIVDKSKFEIALMNYNGGSPEKIFSHHTTLGKMLGDKQIENDLKTPEGIYFFNSRSRAPGIPRKLGDLALGMNYPNLIDRKQGKTGYAIMLHATNDPPRLERNQDSEGCIVVSNEQIQKFAEHVRLGVTPILVYDQWKPEFFSETMIQNLKQAFQKWLAAWQTKDLDSYIQSYADDFEYNGMRLKQYRDYKHSLNRKYDKINVKAENVRYFYHPKYQVVQFNQDYSSTFSSGKQAFQSKGTKVLYWVRDGQGQLRIAGEDYNNL